MESTDKAASKSPTMATRLKAVKPRRELYARLKLKSSRANDLMQGQDPATTATFARVVGQVVLPNEGREEAGRVAIAMLEELHPEAFTPAPATEPVTTKAA